MFTVADEQFMRQALGLATTSLYLTSPNPRVGCVLVRDGQVLGEGATQSAGGDHAEVQAVKQALRRGHALEGATAYVSLEPCAHFGRTPPCADLLVQHKVARVVAAIEDPNPQVAGKGLQRLREAGVDVRCGLMADEARELNIGFFSRMLRGRPWVRMKLAASLDGITALPNGRSQWITSEDARADGHHWRARACVVLTGVGTVLQDDPQLSVRFVDTPRQPRKLLVDSRLQAPPAARLFDDGPVTVFSAKAGAAADALRARGHEVVTLPDAQGKVDLTALVMWLGKQSVNELHVEAGTRLNGSLLRTGVVDELLIYLAPKLLGQGQGLALLGPFDDLTQALQLQLGSVELIGRDLRIIARTPSATFYGHSCSPASLQHSVQ